MFSRNEMKPGGDPSSEVDDTMNETGERRSGYCHVEISPEWDRTGLRDTERIFNGDSSWEQDKSGNTGKLYLPKCFS